MQKIKKVNQEIRFVRIIKDTFDEEYGGSKAEEYEEIKKQLNGNIYTNKEFPASKQSLSLKWKSLSPDQKIEWSTFCWRRPHEIFPNQKIEIFEGQIEPNDIKQGKLGDCYFLSALSVLAERPHLITQLFVSREYNKQGIYSIWINAHGEWRNMVIDDQVPCQNTGTPAFSRAHGQELWVLLLEKVYAQLYGSYERIEGGNPAVAMRDLTGAPYENKDEGTAEEMWDYCFGHYKKGFMLTCYTKSSANVEEENKLGILSGHAYAILRMAEVRDSQQQQARILQVRNPWGRVEWKGAWSDNSKEWTNELKTQLQLEDKDDGIFWICIEDFRQYYEGVGVCKIHEEYLYNSLKFDGRVSSAFILDVTQNTHGYISVNQIDQRFFFDSNPDHMYAFVRIMIGRIINSGEIELVEGDLKQDRNVDMEVNFIAGQYLVLIDFNWPKSDLDASNIIINTYSQKRIKLTQATNLNITSIQAHLCKQYALNNQSTVRHISYQDNYKLDIHKWIGTWSGFLYYYYQNKTKDHNIEEIVTIANLEGYKPIPPLTDQNTTQFNFILGPNQECVALYSQVYSESGRCSYSYKTSSQLPKSTKKPIQNEFILKTIDFSNVQLVSKTGTSLGNMQVAPNPMVNGLNQEISIQSGVQKGIGQSNKLII